MALYQVEDIQAKGKGVVACSDIARGNIILSEAPLFIVPRYSNDLQRISGQIVQQVRNLNKDQQRIFFGLCNSFKELSPFDGIVRTNAMPLGADASNGGVFPTCSRFNHSCCSNANYSWCGRLGRERVVASRNIKKGEEISVSYLSEGIWAVPRKERQQYLSKEFGFQCSCTACSQGCEDVSESDVRRRRIHELDSTIGDGMLIVMNPGRAMAFCQEVLRLLKEEGESDMKVYAAYYDTFQVCVAHGDLARASAFAGLAARVQSDCQGDDADGIEEIRQLVQSPQTHRLAGTTNRWRSKAVNARNPDSDGFETWLWQRAG